MSETDLSPEVARLARLAALASFRGQDDAEAEIRAEAANLCDDSEWASFHEAQMLILSDLLSES